MLAAVAVGVHAQEKPAPAASADDDEFLEFLGSVDSDAADEDWLDYLAQTDILKVAKRTRKTQADERRPASDKADK